MAVWAASIGCVLPGLPEGAYPPDDPKQVGGCSDVVAVPTKAGAAPWPAGRVLPSSIDCDAINSVWLNVGATPITIGCVDFKFLTVQKSRDFEFFNSFDDATSLTITNISYQGQMSGISVSVAVGDVFAPWTSNTITVYGSASGEPVVSGSIVITFDNGNALKICVKGMRILSLLQGEQAKAFALTDPEIVERFVFDVVEHVSDADNHQMVLQSFDPTFEVEQRVGAPYPYATKFTNLINSKGNYPWVVAMLNWPLSHTGLSSGQTQLTLHGDWPREVSIGDFISTADGYSYSITNMSQSGNDITVDIDPPLLSDISKGECVYPAVVMYLASADWKHHHGKFAEFLLRYRRDHAGWSQRTEPRQDWQVIDGFAVFPFIADGLSPVSASFVPNADTWRYAGSNEVRRIQATPRDLLSVGVLLHGVDEINEFKDWEEYHRAKYRPFWLRRPERYYLAARANENETTLRVDDNFEMNVFYGGAAYVRVNLWDGSQHVARVVSATDNTIEISDPLPTYAPAGACIEPLALVRQAGNTVSLTYKAKDVAIVKFKVTAER